MRLTGSSHLSSSLPRIRAARSASQGPGWTAYLDPSRSPPGSCSRPEAMALVVRVIRRWPRCMLDEANEEVAQPQVKGLLRPSAHPACMPRFPLSGLKTRHSSLWWRDSSHGGLEDSDGATRGVPVTLPASVLHQPTRSDVGDAAHSAHM